MKPIKDVMKNISFSCGKYERLNDVAYRMSISRIEFLPVVNEKIEVIGTVTYTDILQALEKNKELKEKSFIADVMKPDTSSIYTFDDEATALRIMRTNHSPYLPVVDTENHLKGVVSFMTLARRIVQLKHQLRKDDERLKVQGLGLSA